MLSIQEVNLLKSQNIELQRELIKKDKDFKKLTKKYEELQNTDLVKKLNTLNHKLKIEQIRNSRLINKYGLKEK